MFSAENGTPHNFSLIVHLYWTGIKSADFGFLNLFDVLRCVYVGDSNVRYQAFSRC